MGLEQTNAEDNYNAALRNTSFVVLMSTSIILSWASYFGVLALTVDRFLAIHLKLRYQEFVNHKRAVAVVILIMMFTSFLRLSLGGSRHTTGEKFISRFNLSV